MPILAWSNLLSTGVAELDAQHRVLVGLLNRLGDGDPGDEAGEIEKQVLDQLVDYTTYHFGFEERLMREHAYAQADAHIREHDALLEQVMVRVERHQRGDATNRGDLMTFLRDWLVNHIMSADKALGRALNASGVR